ncbi:zinc ribbon domain-containing protein, partial [Streptomyces sp. NPDC059701]
MSQMPQQAAVPKCPSCEEPLESDDRFCGACGYDLSAVPARPEDSPAVGTNGTVPAPSSPPDGVGRPPAPGTVRYGRPGPPPPPGPVARAGAGGAPAGGRPGGVGLRPVGAAQQRA